MSKYEAIYFPQKSHIAFVRKTRRPICLLASFLTLAGLFAFVAFLIIPELISCIKLLIGEIPNTIDNLLENKTIAKFLPAKIADALSEIDMKELAGNMTKTLFNGIGTAAETLFSALSSVITFTISIFLSIVFSIYLLLKKEQIICHLKRISENLLPKKLYPKLLNIISTINDSFRSFIVGQCLEALILGVLCIAGMYIFGFPYAVMIGTLIGFTALIPIAGAFIGAGVGAVMILTVSPLKSLLFILFITVLQQLEENLIYPKVVGKKIGLPAFYVLIAITIGGRLMGITGILISVPLFSAVYKIIRTENNS